MEQSKYDLAVIGSGPSGQKAAVAAAKIGKRVVVVERPGHLGGVSLQSGTIPSKTLREGILYFTGFRQRSFYGRNYVVKEQISVADLSFRVKSVKERQGGVVRAQLKRNRIEILDGTARFADPHTLEVEGPEGTRRLSADFILIGCGSRPAHNPKVPVDGKSILDSDQIEGMDRLHRDAIIVGAGVIGLEYASMAAALGTHVTVIEQRDTILDFVDREIVDALVFYLRQSGVTFRLGETLVSVRRESESQVVACLESGKEVRAEILLYTVGRQTNADTLNLPAAGLAADPRGRIVVNEHFQTAVPHIYAAGDVIGFPALASTSMDQGRIASHHMFGIRDTSRSAALPYGIYTVPEISVVGQTEEELTKSKTPYEVGRARYDELAKGQMLGADTGLLKILFDPKTLRVLGVHVFGDQASELVHIGQAVLLLGGTLEYFRDTVFNYPTLAEAYKVAALDGLNRVGASQVETSSPENPSVS
ncbi:MAG TPA: Si-specific NAD(P)(+) transhydrogenase [Thermoanaerobaculia bacterium]|nr:Si-specific NAD(P)(+) transhydrogenase [Thermoanaerobaculia bacterium]